MSKNPVEMMIDDEEVPTRKADKGKKEKGGKENLPWVEKFRPAELSELISHQNIIHTITTLIDKNKLPHLLLYGPPGTGKTSTILACARKLNGPNNAAMTLELNASDERGIDVVREQIKVFASSKQLFSSGMKLVILDEADNMTATAQFALRRVIEKYTKNTRFCLICNYINKIIPALQSRCTKFRFGPLEKDQIYTRMRVIARAENVKLEEDGLEAIVQLADGDMRKCLNVLQACHVAYPVVNQAAVYACTGKPLPSDIEQILNFLLNEDVPTAYRGILELQAAKGLSLTDIVTYVHELCYQVSFPPAVLMYLTAKLSDLEHRLSTGTSEKVQLLGLVGIFHVVADMIIKQAENEDSQPLSQPLSQSQSSQPK